MIVVVLRYKGLGVAKKGVFAKQNQFCWRVVKRQAFQPLRLSTVSLVKRHWLRSPKAKPKSGSNPSAKSRQGPVFESTARTDCPSGCGERRPTAFLSNIDAAISGDEPGEGRSIGKRVMRTPEGAPGWTESSFDACSSRASTVWVPGAGPRGRSR